MIVNKTGFVLVAVFLVATLLFLLTFFVQAEDLSDISYSFSQNHSYHMFDVGFERYNCADYTHDLVVILRENNFTVYPVCGWLNHIYHAIVGVEIGNNTILIEPQTGEIVNDSYITHPRRCIVRGLN